MPRELPSAEEHPRRQPALAALRGLKVHCEFAQAIPVEELPVSQDPVVVPLRPEHQAPRPTTPPLVVRIPRRHSLEKRVDQDPPLFPHRLSPSDPGQAGERVAAASPLPTAAEQPETPVQTTPEPSPADEAGRSVAAWAGLKPLDAQPGWYQGLVIGVHVLPWILFLLVAFRFLPAAWQMEQWPASVQTAATIGFAIFVLSDALFALWYAAFRQGGRGLD